MSRVNRLAVAPDLEVQPRLAFRPLTHGRYLLAFFYGLPFLDQQLRVVPVGTQVGVVMFKNNKLSVADQSTAGIDNAARSRGQYGLAGLPSIKDAGAAAGFPAELDIDPAACRPRPGRWWLRWDVGQRPALGAVVREELDPDGGVRRMTCPG